MIVPGESFSIPAIWDEKRKCYIPDPQYNPHTGELFTHEHKDPIAESAVLDLKKKGLI
jgi:hypothetical protein